MITPLVVKTAGPIGIVALWVAFIQGVSPDGGNGILNALLIAAPPSAIGLAMWNKLNDDIKTLRKDCAASVESLRRDMREDVNKVHDRIDKAVLK